MICYRVNNRVFFIAFADFIYAAHNCPHEHVFFEIFNDQFSRVDWTRYPTESYTELYTRRAHQLRNKYDKIVIAFSGGTDSTTVLKSFYDNNLHVDSIYISHYNNDKYNRQFLGQPHVIADWVRKTWPEQSKHTDIEILDLSRYIEARYQKSEWILDQTKTFHLRFTTSPTTYEVTELFDQKYGAFRWALVTGHEKPEVTADHKYAYYVDHTFSNVMNRPNAELFYLTPDFPEISIKQAHDIARFRSLGGEDYYQLKRSIGQFGDVQTVNSRMEKESIKKTAARLAKLNFSQITRSIDTINHDDDNCLISLIGDYRQRWNHIVENWAKGMASLQTDSTLINYMVNHGYLSSPDQTIQSYYGILSPKYRITLS